MPLKKVKISELEHIDSYRPLEDPSDDNIMAQIADMSVIGAFPADNKNVQVPAEKLRGNTAFREWQLRERAAGRTKTYEDWLKYLREPAQEAGSRVNFLSDHRDKVIDGYWHTWDEENGEYVNTGEIAKGNVMFPYFEVDPADGQLTVTVDPEYNGLQFTIDNNGYLEFSIQ